MYFSCVWECLCVYVCVFSICGKIRHVCWNGYKCAFRLSLFVPAANYYVHLLQLFMMQESNNS
jgi:hypothetical protein